MRVSPRPAAPLMLLAAQLLAAPQPAEAETHPADLAPGERLPIVLAPIAVEAPAGPRSHGALQRLTPPPDAALPGRTLDVLLRDAAGVFAQSRHNLAQDLRLSIRGFGARAPFGIRGLALRLDGIPLTLPDGQSSIDMIDVAALGGADLLRGPASALYGNAAGGVLRLYSDAAPTGASLGHGADGLRELRIAADAEAGDTLLHLQALDSRRDGYRDQSSAHRRLLRLSARRSLGNAGDITLGLAAMDAPRIEDAGGLTAAERARDRRAAAPFAARLDSHEDKDQQEISLRYHHEGRGSTNAYAFHAQRDFYAQLPFPGASRVFLDRRHSGTGLQWGVAEPLGLSRLHLVLGAEAAWQHDRRRRARREADGRRGPITLDQLEGARSAALFAQTRVDLGHDLSLLAGARFDDLQLRVNDHFPADGDDDGGRRFREPSGLLGFDWQPTAKLAVYALAATGFEAPTFTELADPQGGGFNAGLEPQQLRSLELGLRAQTARLHTRLALYRIRVRDELVPFQRAGETRDFFENAGRTAHDGVELDLDYALARHWTLDLAWTLQQLEFLDFHDAGGARLDGRWLPGQPRHLLAAGLDYTRPGGLFGGLRIEAAGRRYADNANRVRSPGQVLVHLHGGWRWRAGDGLWSVSAGIDNLLGREVLDTLRINAAGGRYFEPAPGRTLALALHWQARAPAPH